MGNEELLAIPKDRLSDLRSLSGYTLESAAKRFKISPDNLMALEKKERVTLKQLSKFAEVYKRPLAAFFSSESPTPIHKLADHRINRERQMRPEVYTAERRAYFMANKIAELSGGRSKIPSFAENLSAIDLAVTFRRELEGKGVKLLKDVSPARTLQYYKDAVERLFFIPVMEYPMKSEDIRAFCMPGDLAVIVLNESDKSEIKLFSLFHEMCHLIRKSGALCSLDMELKHKGGEESYCDIFSAEVIVPRNDIEVEMSRQRDVEPQVMITKLSSTYGVSRQVIGLKLYQLDYLSRDQYITYTTGSRKKPAESGKVVRNWNRVFHNRVGSLALNEVKANYSKKNISLMEAVQILDINTKYADNLLKG